MREAVDEALLEAGEEIEAELDQCLGIFWERTRRVGHQGLVSLPRVVSESRIIVVIIFMRNKAIAG